MRCTYLDRVEKDANDVPDDNRLPVLATLVVATMAQFAVIEGPSVF